MFDILKKFFGKFNFESLIAGINSFESEFENISDEKLKEQSLALKKEVTETGDLDSALPKAFALVREAAKRNLKQKHFDVQLIGGIILHQGKIAEMATGEGKTLAATSPAYLNALLSKGVHIITVNDYLAKRDAVWMGQIYHALGLSVGCIVHDASYIYDPTYVLKKEELESVDIDKERDVLAGFKVFHEFLRPIQRKETYQLDILYGTNHEFGFDYLRDNLAYRTEDQVQKGHYFAIIDEVDSILIDEARTPLIIAAPDTESSDFYRVFSKIAANLTAEEDYSVDEKLKSAAITDSGITKVEKMLGINNLYSPENSRLVHYLEESLKAKALFHRDKQYVVRNGEVIIVDEFTGRLMPGRRYSGGLHQAIEAKEGVKIQQESKTYAQITIQNYFRLYEKIAGMTGTAQTSAEEFHKVYNLEAATIPTNKPMIRNDSADLIYKTKEAKYQAVVRNIKKFYESGRPVLVGTASINHNELISGLLTEAGVPHQVLNAKNHEREGEIIAQAGKLKAVTVATNMAGRGVDIVLGGNPADPIEAQKVKELGGLHVIGTERHEARRIDNQLRGRAGRQGDTGSSQFFLSLEDDLLRIFGGERVKKLMETFNLPENEPIESKIISKVVNEAQKKIEGFNFDARKHLLEYDDVLNKQRTAVYKKRQEILVGNITELLSEIVSNSFERFKNQAIEPGQWEKIVVESGILSKEESGENGGEILIGKIKKAITPEKEFEVKIRVLSILDSLWMNHLENLADLQESVRIRAYGQHDPLVEYRRESYNMFQNLFVNFEDWIFLNILKIIPQEGDVKIQTRQKVNLGAFKGKVGRNDPCPCGSGKKYKRCHGA
ncbi:preprotein translocase subunit SecA [Candidatus Wolfebacteria bacterium]|nr:preprotein translocase subunit SecA [Candidatus Wolfebacteria bacterium]